MSTLGSLPNECLLLIYHSLEDFDEAFHLAQCCVRFRRLLQSNYTRILRSIINRSTTYSYDIRLSQFISELQQYSLQFDSRCEPPIHSRPSIQVFLRCLFATSEDLTDVHVFSIVDRWQRVRRLQHLYRGSCFLRAPLAAAQHHKTCRCSLYVEDGLDHIGNFFDFQQTRRFYKASMAYWLAIEARRLAHVSNYRNLEEKGWVHRFVESLWIDGSERTLLETMDMLEVYIFLYEYLVGKLFLDKKASSWRPGEGPCLDWGWDYFVSSCRLHVGPLEIAQFTPCPGDLKRRSPPYDKIALACSCGVFDRQGDILDGSTNDGRDDRFSLNELEQDVELKITAMGTGDHQDYASIWACYRRRWNGYASAVFWWAKSSQDVIRQIDRYALEADCMAIHPDFVHLSRQVRRVSD